MPSHAPNLLFPSWPLLWFSRTLADFALNEFEKGWKLTVIPTAEEDGGLGCVFEHGRRKGPLTIEFAGSFILPERDGRDRRVASGCRTAC